MELSADDLGSDMEGKGAELEETKKRTKTMYHEIRISRITKTMSKWTPRWSCILGNDCDTLVKTHTRVYFGMNPSDICVVCVLQRLSCCVANLLTARSATVRRLH